MKIQIAAAILLSATVYLATSCSPSRSERVDRIGKLEQSLKSATSADTAKASELIGAYTSFAGKYKDDTLSAAYLFKAGNLAISFGKPLQGIELFKRLEKEFPASLRAPEALFMQAFAFENVIGDLGSASRLYNEFLVKYPGHHLADDARQMIRYLGKSDEMIRDFDQAGRQDSIK